MREALTARQKAFVQEYLTDLNSSQAAVRAGYSPMASNVTGSRLRKHPRVAQAIEEAMQQREESLKVSQDEILRELYNIAFGDLRDLAEWDEDGLRLKNSALLEDEVAASVAEISQSSSGLKIKRYDKVKALELLSKHLGLFTDKVDLGGNVNAEITVFRIPDNGRNY